jgi:Putative transposase/Transposase zinc-binding domain
MTSCPAAGEARPRPALELADVIRLHGDGLADVTSEQRKVLNALSACRTAVLGGHVETCDHCGHQRVAYNSCRNRHCPKCQGSACAQWMEARAEELLPVEYFHVVFTLPDVFNGLALANKRAIYGVLFDAVAETLTEVAANPRHLGAKIGFMGILHTWGQNLDLHPHVHCVVPGGGLSPDGSGWIACKAGFFLPVRVLSKVFRGKFIDLLRRSHAKTPLCGINEEAELNRLIDASVRTDWVVYSKPPFGGPEQVLKYLSRYTHRIAISNTRLAAMDDKTVTFRWKDYAHENRERTMTLEGPEFLRRFLMHVVPLGFMRIRHFGLFANRFRVANLSRCRELLAVVAPWFETDKHSGDATTGLHDLCPLCGKGEMARGAFVRPVTLHALRMDTS